MDTQAIGSIRRRSALMRASIERSLGLPPGHPVFSSQALIVELRTERKVSNDHPRRPTDSSGGERAGRGSRRFEAG